MRRVPYGCKRAPSTELQETACCDPGGDSREALGSCIRKKQCRPAGCSRVWQGAGRGSWAQAGAAWVRQGAARCSRLQPVVVLGGNSFGQQGAAGRGRVRAGGGSWAQPGAAQWWPGAAGCALPCIRKKLLRPAGCSREWQRVGGAGRGQVQHGCSRMPPGAAGCSQSLC